ncbi:hypothetical protein D3C75_809210 [compost metagenome]
MRQITLLIAFGTMVCGSLHSPAAVPTSSIEAKANTTPCTRTKAGNRPWGKKPPLSVIKWKPVALPSSILPLPRKTVPTTRNATIARTLISANQNSISANHFTPIMFIVPTIPRAQSANTHCGISPNAPQ